jgi:uncharacterized protein
MLRALIYSILGLFAIMLVRMITTTLMKGVGELFQEEATAKKNPPTTGGGPLKRDPVCGTYIPADASVRKSVNGEVLYFCSPECRDKYGASV